MKDWRREKRWATLPPSAFHGTLFPLYFIHKLLIVYFQSIEMSLASEENKCRSKREGVEDVNAGAKREITEASRYCYSALDASLFLRHYTALLAS